MELALEGLENMHFDVIRPYDVTNTLLQNRQNLDNSDGRISADLPLQTPDITS